MYDAHIWHFSYFYFMPCFLCVRATEMPEFPPRGLIKSFWFWLPAHNTYLWPEELHDSNLSIHAHLLDGPQPLCCDHIDLQPCVFGYEQIEVFCRGEVTCRHISKYNMLITLWFRWEELRKKMTEKGGQIPAMEPEGNIDYNIFGIIALVMASIYCVSL